MTGLARLRCLQKADEGSAQVVHDLHFWHSATFDDHRKI